jgi:hypothetical protein
MSELTTADHFHNAAAAATTARQHLLRALSELDKAGADLDLSSHCFRMGVTDIDDGLEAVRASYSDLEGLSDAERLAAAFAEELAR